MLLLLLGMLQLSSADTLKVRSVDRPPRAEETIDSVRYGRPQVHLTTGQGTALVWLLRAADTLFVAASIPDSSPYWGDDFVFSLDTRGDAAPNPQRDDFQWYFRRVLDSSVVFRGRNGRWQPPRDDPDWRLGLERSGGGWEVSGRNSPRGWYILMRLNPVWFVGENGQLPRVAFRIYDDAPSGWHSWPLPRRRALANSVEDEPALWVPIH